MKAQVKASKKFSPALWGGDFDELAQRTRGFPGLIPAYPGDEWLMFTQTYETVTW